MHHEVLLQGRTVNKEYYLEVMRRLREAIRQKLTELWKNQLWILHPDHARAHISMLARIHRPWHPLIFFSCQM